MNIFRCVRGGLFLSADHGIDGIFAVTGSTLYPLAPNDRALVSEVKQVYCSDLDRLRLGVRQYQESQKK
jgi:hypothetical protein